jgi:hypothetical protein
VTFNRGVVTSIDAWAISVFSILTARPVAAASEAGRFMAGRFMAGRFMSRGPFMAGPKLRTAGGAMSKTTTVADHERERGAARVVVGWGSSRTAGRRRSKARPSTGTCTRNSSRPAAAAAAGVAAVDVVRIIYVVGVINLHGGVVVAAPATAAATGVVVVHVL